MNQQQSSSDDDVDSEMSDATKSAIDKKHKVRKNLGCKSPEYKLSKSRSKQLVKEDRMNQIAKDLDAISSLPPHKQYYSANHRL